MALMEKFVRSIKKEKREEMMVNMMPSMMEGIDINEFMPKMMAEMLKDLTADDVVAFLKDIISDSSKLTSIGAKIAEANLMPKMMMKTWKSKLSFDDTVATLREHAPKNNWHIPDTRDLQELWASKGVNTAQRKVVLYFCNAQGGSSITEDDALKCMSVMMPMGVSVYETSKGTVEVAAMNIGMMSGMFAGVTKEALSNSATNLENTIKPITE